MVAELAGASPLSRPALSPPSAPEAGALPAMPLRAGATMAPELKQEQAVVSTVAETPARGPASPFDFITCVVVLVATVAYASAWHTGLTWWREASFADMPHTRPDAEISLSAVISWQAYLRGYRRSLCMTQQIPSHMWTSMWHGRLKSEAGPAQ